MGFWKAKSPRHGRPRKWESPEQLQEAIEDYFQWVEDNPLYEAKAFAFQGQSWVEEIPKMRAMTVAGACTFLGMVKDTWYNYRKLDGFSDVIINAEEIMRNQKFTGAAADLLNANIISRDLGLADKQDHTSSDGSMKPEVSVNMSASEAAKAYQDMMDGK